VLELHVQPGAKRTEVVGLHGGRLKIRLAARAVDGAANAALVEAIAGVFRVARGNVRIAAGMQAKKKTVVIAGATALPQALTAWR
jgi:hypothetical protein